MTSTTVSHSVKPKSLTLLELCQTINDLRHVSSRSTAQILTRRLYLHPLTINSTAKQQSTKIINNNLLQIERINQAHLEKRNSPAKQKPYRGLAILSSSLPLTARSSTKQASSLISDSSNDFETSSTSFTSSRGSFPTANRNNPLLSNRVTLPPISRVTSTSTKHTLLSKSSYIPSQSKSYTNNEDHWEKIDVWVHLARTLQKPTPIDPPTTPLDGSFNLDLEIFQDENQQQQQETEQDNHHFIHEIKIYKRTPDTDSIINEHEKNKEN